MTLILDKLPRIAPEKASMSEALRRLVKAASLEGPNTPIPIGGFSECSQRMFSAPLEFEIGSRYGKTAVTLECKTIELVLDALLPEWRGEDEQNLPFEWAAILAFDLVTRGTQLESLDAKINVGKQPAKSGPRFFGKGNFSGMQHLVAISVVEARLGLPLPLAERAISNLPLHLPAFFDLKLPSITLDLADLGEIGKGDVLMVPNQNPEQLFVNLCINDGSHWTGHLTDNGCFFARTNIRELGNMDTEEAIYPETQDLEAGMEDQMPENHGQDFLDLPMNVDFQFHRKTMTLADVKELAPGAILDLGIELSDPVSIRVNERHVGKGQLIQIGERVGVQILRWNDETRAAL